MGEAECASDKAGCSRAESTGHAEAGISSRKWVLELIGGALVTVGMAIQSREETHAG